MLTRIDAIMVCTRCSLRRHLDRVIPPDSVGALHPLREVILAAEPMATRHWLDRAQDLLTGLHEGRLTLEHAALDVLPQRKAVEHLRALLISTKILPPDPARELRWLEHQLPNLLADLNEPHRRIATSWARWTVLARLRRLSEHGRELIVPVRNGRRQIEQVAAFLVQLQDDGRGLAECSQHDIDTWFAGPGAIRSVLRPFLVWASRHRHMPAELTLPRSYKGKPTTPVDSEQRWNIAKRLIEDNTLDPVDRVAGALVVLYAQPLARIITLTTSDVLVVDDRVQLRLGADPLDLPEPFATLIRALPHKRRESTANQLPNPWLFAGSHAGRHLNANVLGSRLQQIGIEPSRMRLAAADQLCREIPPAMLAGVLGLHTATVARATAQASGHWSNYTADRQP